MVDYALTPAGKKMFANDRHLRTAGLYIKLVAANALVDTTSKTASLITQTASRTR